MRRAIVRRALRGESKADIAKRYGLARQSVYRIVDEDTTDTQRKFREAQAEFEYRGELNGMNVRVPCFADEDDAVE